MDKSYITQYKRSKPIFMKSYGIQGNVLGWIEDFLTGRKQRVIVNGQASEYCPVISGIPQGSVLGPVLFVIYINDLPQAVNSDVYLFEDDTKLYRVINSIKDSETLQQDLTELEHWSHKWLLRFHPKKCKVVTIGRNTSHSYRYSMSDADGTTLYLEHTDTEKDLGVTIDCKLDFDKHINEKVNKANMTMGLIRRSFEYLDQANFLLLYKALVRPHLEYANAVWCPYKQKHIDIIEGVQRRATKLVPGLRNLPYEERLKRLNLPTMVYRRLRGDMIEIYKCTRDVYDGQLTDFISPGIVDHTRGHSQKLYLKYARLNVRKNVLGIRAVAPWNDLPGVLVEAPSVRTFEGRLDRWWREEEVKHNYKAKLLKGRKIREAEETDIEAELP